jgi:hypothetical protein
MEDQRKPMDAASPARMREGVADRGLVVEIATYSRKRKLRTAHIMSQRKKPWTSRARKRNLLESKSLYALRQQPLVIIRYFEPRSIRPLLRARLATPII